MNPLPTPSLLAAELLKIRKRWLLYVLLVVMVAGAAVHIWLVGYATWVDERNQGEFAFGSDALRSFTLPYALPSLLESGQFWGAILVGFLVSSAVGTEYGWGTVRQALMRGQTRAQFLTVKLIGLVALASASLLAALGVGLLFSVLATSVAGEPITFDAPDGPSALDAVLMILRAGYAIIPYGLLAFCLATIGRSTTLGVAGTLVFIIMESIMVAILGNINTVTQDVRAFFPAHNAVALLGANRIGGGDYYAMAPREQLDVTQLPDPAVAALVLATYSVLLLAITYRVFQRRDLTA